MAWLLIFLGSITNLGDGFFTKKGNKYCPDAGVLFTAAKAVTVMLFFIATDTNGFNIPKGLWLYGIIGGIFYFSASFLHFTALKLGSFAISMLVLSYSMIIPILYGLIFYKDTATVLTYLGFAAIMLSLYFLRSDKKSENKGFSAKWIVCLVAVFLTNGFLSVIIKVQQTTFDNLCNNEFMAISLGICAVLSTITGVMTNRKNIKSFMKKGCVWGVATGLSNGASNLIGVILNNLMPLAILSPTRGAVNITVSTLFSVAFYKEKLLKRQIFGIVLGICAVILLNIKI